MSGHQPFTSRIAIVGCGALGALYGVYLLEGGADVHFITRSDYDAARRDGYRITTPSGAIRTVHPPVYRDPADLGPVDLVIVALKGTDNAALPALLAPLCAPSTLVLTLQNGLGNEEYIARILQGFHGGDAATRGLGGVAFRCSNRTAPAQIHHIDQGWIHMAELSGPARERTHAIAECFRRGGVDCHVFDSLPTVRWQKLAWNIPFNVLSVLANHADTRSLLDDGEIRALIPRIMDEVARVAACDGALLDQPFLQRLITVTEGIGPYRTSMLLDQEAGRPLEIDAIIGEPLRRARHHNIDVPRMELLHALVRRWDPGRG